MLSALSTLKSCCIIMCYLVKCQVSKTMQSIVVMWKHLVIVCVLQSLERPMYFISSIKGEIECCKWKWSFEYTWAKEKLGISISLRASIPNDLTNLSPFSNLPIIIFPLLNFQITKILTRESYLAEPYVLIKYYDFLIKVSLSFQL